MDSWPVTLRMSPRRVADEVADHLAASGAPRSTPSIDEGLALNRAFLNIPQESARAYVISLTEMLAEKEKRPSKA